jgi:hypothetical protein
VDNRNLFERYLLGLGYTSNDIRKYLHEDSFNYPVDLENGIYVKYAQAADQQTIFEKHQRLWNRNSDLFFIVTQGNKTYIIDSKQKPVQGTFKYIESFSYGINSQGYDESAIEKISKHYIDSGFFYEFFLRHKSKRQDVDKDLLLNLLALRNDLGKSPIAHILILRCLFVKYLEDRGIFEKGYLLERLKDESPRKLIIAFNEIKKINGDVFKFDELTSSDITIQHLRKLSRFFETDYRLGQGTLFPYQFDEIPIQLISHVYEAFLKNEDKKGKGIYYTPYFLVDFVLKRLSIDGIDKTSAKILDPAVGSGAFLVECFKKLQAKGENLSFEKKKKILETQIFGIDVDKTALQISAFSLYLALLETESAEFIREKIEKAYPILPSLIGKNLIAGNALLDNKIFGGASFDFIVSNPPWGSASESQSDEVERSALSGESPDFPEYRFVSDYEKSQAFLTRVKRWSNENTRVAMVVKNSIFLNRGALEFRKEFLANNKVEEFYELSHYNKILFKKRVIGKIGKQKVEIGASEPCAVVVFRPCQIVDEYDINYMAPRLNRLAESFNIIHCSSNEQSILKKSELIANDDLWRVLVNGDKEDFELIVKVNSQRELLIEARSGFQPKVNMKQLGRPIMKKMIEPIDFEQFTIKRDSFRKFNWNQELHRTRDESIYVDSRILIPVRPLKSDRFLFRAIHLTDEVVFKDNILGVKLKEKKENKHVNDHLPYLALFNSQLISYLFHQLSTQWGKGEGKRDTIRNFDVEALPLKQLNKSQTKEFELVVNKIIEQKTNGNDVRKAEDKLNDLVFNLYQLLDYEKEIIKEFYLTRVEREGQPLVTIGDITKYFETFKDAFGVILSGNHALTATFQISSILGAVICFSITDKKNNGVVTENTELNLLRLVKANQLSKADATKILFEEKVKIYSANKFYIIKSNLLKDWTVRQAMKDAREEIGLFLKQLPVKK